MSRVPHLTLSSFHDYLYSTGESELDSSPAPATHHGARSPPCEQETAIAAGAWGGAGGPRHSVPAPPAEGLRGFQGICLHSAGAHSSLQNTPTSILTAAPVSAWQSLSSQSLPDLSFEFCPQHSLNSFPFSLSLRSRHQYHRTQSNLGCGLLYRRAFNSTLLPRMGACWRGPFTGGLVDHSKS